MSRRTLWWVMLSSAIGCSAPLVESGGFKVREKEFGVASAKLKPRAAFDLGCSQEQIQLVVLAVSRHPLDTGEDTQPKQIGASGCGKKAAYIDILDNGDWVLNSNTHSAESK